MSHNGFSFDALTRLARYPLTLPPALHGFEVIELPSGSSQDRWNQEVANGAYAFNEHLSSDPALRIKAQQRRELIESGGGQGGRAVRAFRSLGRWAAPDHVPRFVLVQEGWNDPLTGQWDWALLALEALLLAGCPLDPEHLGLAALADAFDATVDESRIADWGTLHHSLPGLIVLALHAMQRLCQPGDPGWKEADPDDAAPLFCSGPSRLPLNEVALNLAKLVLPSREVPAGLVELRQQACLEVLDFIKARRRRAVCSVAWGHTRYGRVGFQLSLEHTGRRGNHAPDVFVSLSEEDGFVRDDRMVLRLHADAPPDSSHRRFAAFPGGIEVFVLRPRVLERAGGIDKVMKAVGWVGKLLAWDIGKPSDGGCALRFSLHPTDSALASLKSGVDEQFALEALRRLACRIDAELHEALGQ